MDVVEGIRRHGFRKWYERQLIESHLLLVTTVLSVVAVMASMEAFDPRQHHPHQHTLDVCCKQCGHVWAMPVE